MRGREREKKRKEREREREKERREKNIVRGGKLEVELQSGYEYEAAGEHLLVREGNALVGELDVAEQQDVDVDRARPVAHPLAMSVPRSVLQPLDRVEQIEWLELGLNQHASIQEGRLVEHLPHRVGVVDRKRPPSLAPRPRATHSRLPANARGGRRRWIRGRAGRGAAIARSAVEAGDRLDRKLAVERFEVGEILLVLWSCRQTLEANDAWQRCDANGLTIPNILHRALRDGGIVQRGEPSTHYVDDAMAAVQT